MTDEENIWKTLNAKINNPYGTAALMGNLFAESSLNPLCKTGGDKSLAGWQYAQMVDDGTIDIHQFSHDGIAFGLAQWRYWSRKEQMYITWKDLHDAGITKNVSIGNLDLQLMFLLNELPSYKTVWNTLQNATSIREASDIVLERYEKPAGTSEKVKKKRAEFGQTYYDRYALADIPTPEFFWVRTTENRVNVRRGNGKQYAVLTQIEKKGTTYPLVATSDNNWYAIDILISRAKFVGWISGEFAEVIRE